MKETESGLLIPDTSPVSSRIYIREGMGKFFDAVDDTDVQEVLEGILSRPEDVNSGYGQRVTGLLSNVLDEDQFDILYDHPVNVVELTSHLLQMNHPDVWFQLLHRATSKDPSLTADLAMAFPLTNQNSAKKEISERISESNFGFFGRTLIYYGMAATYGDTFPALLSPHELDILDVHTTQPNARYLSGLEVGKHFGSPALTPVQTVRRLQELFPPNAKNGTDTPALRFANATQAFVTPNPATASGISACPGKDMTRSLFTAYGNILGKEDFRGGLAKKIGKK